MSDAIEKRHGYCEIVDREVLYIRKRVKNNWLLMLLQLVITGGLWAFFIIHHLSFSEPWTCTICGQKHY